MTHHTNCRPVMYGALQGFQQKYTFCYLDGLKWQQWGGGGVGGCCQETCGPAFGLGGGEDTVCASLLGVDYHEYQQICRDESTDGRKQSDYCESLTPEIMHSDRCGLYVVFLLCFLCCFFFCHVDNNETLI